MRVILLVIIGALGFICLTNSKGVSEDDGFRRLLRRASAEADRPLIREQRRNKEADDEDGFGDIIQQSPQDEISRKRRQDEEKRSFDTDDVDNKAGYTIREDWTGDSRISDADRQELENLFQKLNAPDVSEVKTDITRSTADEENNVDSAANNYASWLMTQPAEKMSAALTHKADVDHKLTEMFFQTKRAKISFPKCDKTQPDCKCKQTCHPYTVARYTPCHCSTINPERAYKYHHKISDNLHTKRHKEEAHVKEESHVKYPEPVHWRRPEKKSSSPSSKSSTNCTTTECLCARTCSPKNVISSSPCECAMTAADAKHVISQGSRLCTDDSPTCLCTRACYPKAVNSFAPCNCDGDDEEMKKVSALVPRPAAVTTAVNVTKSALPDEPVKPAKPAKQLTPILDRPSATIDASAPKLTQAQQVGSQFMDIQKAQLCADASPECKCKKHCYPYTVQKVRPCSCRNATSGEILKAINPQNVQPQNELAQKSTNQVLHAPQVITQTQMKYVSPPMLQSSNNTQNELTNTSAVAAQVPAFVQSPSAGPIVSEPRPIGQVPVVPITAQLLPLETVLSNKTVTQASQQSFSQNGAQLAYPNFVNTTNTTRGAQRSIDPIASGWCKQACHPLDVAVDKPCKCIPSSQGFFPPRAPEGIVPEPAPQAVQPQQQPAVHARLASVQTASVQAGLYQTGSSPVASVVNPPSTLNNANTRNQVLDTAPIPGLPAVSAVDATPQGLFGTIEPIYTKHPSYQGCYKDKKPIRDLPKRFTRFDTTPEACISECKYQNYKFAGVQYGYLCFCGNAFGRYGRVKDQDCNSLCNGDPKRHCGAFWHSSVYSVDGKEYDPTDFDFAKIDAAERLRDTLPAPAVRQVKKAAVKPKSEATYPDTQGANVATHLMKAAQAALKAAQKLLPSVSKKHKLHKKDKKGQKHKKGRKEKREDDEEDEELMQERMSSLASLSAAHEILKKTDFGMAKREAEKEKRSIDEDSDPYDPDDGKDLLIAYLSNVDRYNRQVRSVDDDDDDDDDLNTKPNFEYRRMVIGEGEDGEFVEKYEDAKPGKNKENKSTEKIKKRSISEGSGAGDKKKRSISEGSGAGDKKKRSISEGSGAGDKKKRSISEGSGAGDKKKRSISEGSGAGDKKKRSISEGSGAGDKKKRLISEGIGAGDKKKRSISEGSGAGDKKKRSISEGSGAGDKKKRSISEGSGAGDKKKHSISEESGAGDKKKRSISEGSGAGDKKKRSISEGSGAGDKKKRSVSEGSGAGDKKKRSIAVSTSIEHAKRSMYSSGNSLRKKRSVDGSGVNVRSLFHRSRRSLIGSRIENLKRSVAEGSANGKTIRKRRSADTENILPYGAMKMAARGESIEDIDASLKSLETIEKRDEIPKEAFDGDDSENEGEDESGESEDESEDESEGDSEVESGESEEDDEEHDVNRRESEDDMELLFEKRSVDETKAPKVVNSTSENAHLKSDVEKGVDSLLNLVVELYKQQKTIKAFETSVRSLRHDILRELNVPNGKKSAATKKVRDEIEKTARERLHVLTSSIEHKITEFAKTHPEASKQANLASALLPKLPLNDEKLAEAKKEISRRAAELDNIEDVFPETFQQSDEELPEILKEHFRRNAETESIPERKAHGKNELSRMHREVQNFQMDNNDNTSEDYEQLFD